MECGRGRADNPGEGARHFVGVARALLRIVVREDRARLGAAAPARRGAIERRARRAGGELVLDTGRGALQRVECGRARRARVALAWLGVGVGALPVSQPASPTVSPAPQRRVVRKDGDAR